MYNESKDAAGNYPIRMIPKGTLFHTVNAAGEPHKKVYVRGDYNRSTRTYECSNYEDANDVRYLSGTRLANVGFTY